MFCNLTAGIGFPKYNPANNGNFRCGNYDGDDEETCEDYDPDEDLRMIYDDEDYDEQYES